MELLHQQLVMENLVDFAENNSIFINKWVFVLPWTIDIASQLISYALKLNETEKNLIGFELTAWKSM